MNKLKFVVLFFLLVFAVIAPQAQAVILGSDADTWLRDAEARGSYEYMQIQGASTDFAGYLRFDLSSLSGLTIQSAVLKLTKVEGSPRNDTLVTARFALHGLNDIVGNTPQDWDEATLSESGTNPVGQEWNGVVPLDLSYVTDLDMETVAGITETVVDGGNYGGYITVTGDPLVAFLQGRVDAGSLATFIITNDDGNDRGYGLGTKENATESYRPSLEIIPEPATIALLGLGGLALLRRKR